MNELLMLLITTLKSYYSEIYPSFDAVPVNAKSRTLFVVVSPENFQIQQSFPGETSGISPFSASFRISALCPASASADRLTAFFDSVIIPALCDGFLTELQCEAPRTDSKLQKLVCSGVFRMKGLYLPEQEETA